jgi:hypothetical protein
MNRSNLSKTLLLAILVGILVWVVQRNIRHQAGTAESLPAPQRPEASPEAQAPGGFTVIRSRPLPRVGKAPSDELIAIARQHLVAGGREGRCGAYSLLGDVTDPGLLATCEALAAELDTTYHARVGVEPLSQPAELILLFGNREGYRTFADQQGMSSAGYAGFSIPSRGFTATWAESAGRLELARTLAHELTHLVNRRALGGNLPRWLSEGLADAIGDTATEDGIGPLTGLRGVEGEAERLRQGLESGKAGSLLALASQKDYNFDSSGTSYDYEQSALLVRYLLLEPTLAPRFRTFLTWLSEGGDATPEKLQEYLELDWTALERGFLFWLDATRA